MKSLLALLSAGVLLTAAFSACSSGAAEEAGTDDNPLRTITLTPTQLGLMPGEERQLVATVSDGAPVKWNSSDWDAVSVSAEGVVKALSYGIATVTAASGHATASCDITVPMASVSPSSVQLKVGESLQFETESIPADLQFEWSTSGEKVITVKNGMVTAVAEGSAMVIAKAAGLQANAMVTVSNTRLNYVYLDRCESINENGGSWQTDAGAPTLDASDPREGLYCVRKDFPGAATVFFSKSFGKSVDASSISIENGYFVIDMYISNVSALRLDEGDAQIEIASSATLDQNELHWMFRNSLGLNDGWNHLELPLAEALANDEIDLSQIRRIRIYNTANNGAVVMKIDNLMLLEKQP